MKDRYDPRGRDLAWFCSEDGVASFDLYTSGKGFLREKKVRGYFGTPSPEVRKKGQGKANRLKRDASFCYPYVYFEALVDACPLVKMPGFKKGLVAKDHVTNHVRQYAIDALEEVAFQLLFYGKMKRIEDAQKRQRLILNYLRGNPILLFLKRFDLFHFEEDGHQECVEETFIVGQVLTLLSSWACIALRAREYGRCLLSLSDWIYDPSTYYERGELRHFAHLDRPGNGMDFLTLAEEKAEEMYRLAKQKIG